MGALLRRGLARLSENVFLQPFCAAFLAGAVGALAVRYQLSSSLRLVAVCPCMILVPGPHMLNGGLDLIRSHIHLGASRILFALLVVVAIATGLLCGLVLLGANLPVEAAGRDVPLWQDVIAAGVAVAAYSIFFSTPLSVWPRCQRPRATHNVAAPARLGKGGPHPTPSPARYRGSQVSRLFAGGGWIRTLGPP